MIPLTPNDAKVLARALRSGLEPHLTLSHGQALDVLARMAGLADWNALAVAGQEVSYRPSGPAVKMGLALPSWGMELFGQPRENEFVEAFPCRAVDALVSGEDVYGL